jgi:hypothetical protein
MRSSLLPIALSLLTAPVLSQGQAPAQGSPRPIEPPKAQAPKPAPKIDDQADRSEAVKLIHELNTVMEECSQARVQAQNLQKLLEVFDGDKSPEANQGERIQVNQQMRQKLLQGLRNLREKAQRVATRVRISTLPDKRAFVAKTRTRIELEKDPAIRRKYERLLADQVAEIEGITEQIKGLKGRISGVESAILRLEKQLDYLELVKESIRLGNKLSEELKKLNQEMADVIQALGANQDVQ